MLRWSKGESNRSLFSHGKRKRWVFCFREAIGAKINGGDRGVSTTFRWMRSCNINVILIIFRLFVERTVHRTWPLNLIKLSSCLLFFFPNQRIIGERGAFFRADSDDTAPYESCTEALNPIEGRFDDKNKAADLKCSYLMLILAFHWVGGGGSE